MTWMLPESVSLRNSTLSFQQPLASSPEPESKLKQGVTGEGVACLRYLDTLPLLNMGEWLAEASWPGRIL